MSGLNRYIMRQVFVGMLFVSIALTCIIWLTQSLRFVEMIVNKGVSISTFIYLTVLLLPNFLSIILPVALFTVIVFVYNRMITDRELVVMRAAGLSQTALAKPALYITFAVMVIIYILNLWLLPNSYRLFRELQWEIRYNYSHVLLQEGAFNPVTSKITVYIREQKSDGQLLGILVHDERKKEKPVTIIAERGGMIETDDGARVVMFNGNRQEIDQKTNQLSILYFDRYIFDLKTTPTTTTVRGRGGRERTLPELIEAANDPNTNPKEVGRLIMEAHRRILSPFSALGFAMVGLCCLISGAFTRRNQMRRVITAVVIVVTLQALELGTQNLSTKNTQWIPLMYIMAFLPPIISYIYMVKRHGARKATMTKHAMTTG